MKLSIHALFALCIIIVLVPLALVPIWDWLGWGVTELNAGITTSGQRLALFWEYSLLLLRSQDNPLASTRDFLDDLMLSCDRYWFRLVFKRLQKILAIISGSSWSFFDFYIYCTSIKVLSGHKEFILAPKARYLIFCLLPQASLRDPESGLSITLKSTGEETCWVSKWTRKRA